MAKLTRESRLRERRVEKAARKDRRRQAALEPDAPDELLGDTESDSDAESESESETQPSFEPVGSTAEHADRSPTAG